MIYTYSVNSAFALWSHAEHVLYRLCAFRIFLNLVCSLLCRPPMFYSGKDENGVLTRMVGLDGRDKYEFEKLGKRKGDQ